MWNDPKTYMLIINVATLVVVVAMKFNDLKHLAKDVTSLKRKVSDLEKETKAQGERISKIEGKLEK